MKKLTSSFDDKITLDSQGVKINKDVMDFVAKKINSKLYKVEKNRYGKSDVIADWETILGMSQTAKRVYIYE